MRFSLVTRAATSTTNRIKSINDIQKLYMLHPASPGSVFFLPKGTRIVDKLVSFMKQQMKLYGFQEVITPQLFKNALWKQSGHWKHYKDDMFSVLDSCHHTASKESAVEEGYSLKPMNCPGHCLIYASQERSFRELPLRFSDFSPLHRNEASGALTGLTRVRRFHQDDGHIFCTPDQVASEISKSLDLVSSVYGRFGLNFEPRLSTRPEEFMGSKELWDRAEQDLKTVLGQSVLINEGDGAFYGPKIDFLVTDNLGKIHQLATIQLDFQLPRQFELKYDDDKQQSDTPVMIHRAVFGSIERFLALLIDHYNGKWPFWINPVQAVVIPVSESHLKYGHKVAEQLKSHGFDIEISGQSEPLGGRIRKAIESAASYVLVVGNKELETNTVSLRSRESNELTAVPLEEVVKEFNSRIAHFS